MTRGTPTVRLLLFASARETVGRPSLDWPVPGSGVTAGGLVRRLEKEYPALAPTLRTSRFVLNGQYIESRRTRVRPGDEFAVHPPYGGG